MEVGFKGFSVKGPPAALLLLVFMSLPFAYALAQKYFSTRVDPEKRPIPPPYSTPANNPAPQPADSQVAWWDQIDPSIGLQPARAVPPKQPEVAGPAQRLPQEGPAVRNPISRADLPKRPKAHPQQRDIRAATLPENAPPQGARNPGSQEVHARDGRLAVLVSSY